MDLSPYLVETKLRRLSLDQLKALLILCRHRRPVFSQLVGKKMARRGKSLGGIFSSLSRQQIKKQPLILPYGRVRGKRNLRWRFNEEIVSARQAAQIIEKILLF